MNPDDLIRAIRRAFAPTPNQQRTQDIINSPTADSLWATMGNTRPSAATPIDERPLMGAIAPAVRSVAGYSATSGSPATYNPMTDAMALPDRMQRNRHTLIHEAGHRYDAKTNGMRLGDGRYDFPEMPASQERALPESERTARQRVDNYYRTNPAEGAAQAYTSAYEFLSSPRSQRVEGARWDRKTVMRKLADMEGRTPGAGEIVRDLLKKDIFRGHPLSEFVR